eukprot:tig00020610_g11965.t1
MSDDEGSDKGLEVDGGAENEPESGNEAQPNQNLIDDLFGGSDEEGDEPAKAAPAEPQDESKRAQFMRERLKQMLEEMPNQKGKDKEKSKKKRKSEGGEDKPKRKRKESGDGDAEKKPKKPRKKKEAEPGAESKPKRPRKKKDAGPAPAEGGDGALPGTSGVQFDEEETSGPKNELDEALERLKAGKRAKKSQLNAEQIKEQVVGFVNRMERAADDDMEANRARKPAINKLKMVQEVVAQLEKRPMRPYFMDCQILQVLARWLQRMPDGSLPNVNVRSAVLKCLKALSLGSEDMDLLANTDLGKSVTYLGQFAQESPENQRLARELKDSWARYTFQKSTDFSQLREYEMERADREGVPLRRSDAADSPQEENRRMKVGDAGFVPHARIPYKMEFNFLRRPESSAEASQSQSARTENKDSAKFKIMKKITEKKSTAVFRPHKMSVEGRNMYKTV